MQISALNVKLDKLSEFVEVKINEIPEKVTAVMLTHLQVNGAVPVTAQHIQDIMEENNVELKDYICE